MTDGVKWLTDQGYADPKRIGIYGGSYGGYTTLAGVTFTPDLHAAAVDYVGVSNLLTFMETIPAYWMPYLPQLHAMVGHPKKDKERLTATSTALRADKIKTPLFIAQGANDPRVKKAESDQMVEALRKRSVDNRRNRRNRLRGLRLSLCQARTRRGVSRCRQIVGDASAHWIQIDIGHAGEHRIVVQQGLTAVASLPEAPRAAIFLICQPR